ncbi:MAG TPA: TonB-dependent receptor [Thermoanaerobaculia bacterium]|nr:TonB-dependent receptor [Thermoanaerobaculia bacterium]
MSTQRFRVSLFAFAVLFLAVPVLAETTGTIEGTVVDASRSPLPGVTVAATSPALQGDRTALTDAGGRFRLSLLPPGSYKVTATLAGFAPKERATVVGLDRVVSIEIGLSPTVSEAVTVTAEAPAVETASTTSGANLSAKTFQNLPTGRNYSSVVQLAAGTSSDTADTRNGSITVYGSTGLENAFLVDGVNTTGVEFGNQGKTLNFEFIQEVEVKTGGYEAEHGHATGGIVNVITKSGGNEFHGDVFAYLDRDSFQADNKHEGEVISSGVQTGFRRSDFGLDIGGYAMKDRLWFFAAYDRVDNSSDKRVTVGPAAGTLANLSVKRDLFSVKLTGRLSEAHSLIFTVIGDPEKDSGAVGADIIGPPSTYEGEQKFGGTDFSLRYEGLFGAHWTATAQAGRHKETNDVTPGSGASAIQYVDNRGDALTAAGGFGRIDNRDFTRDDYRLDVSSFWGAHSVKAGLEYEKLDANVSRFFTGGQLVTILNPLEGDTRTLYQHYYWTTPTASLPNAPSVTFTAEPNHKQISAYVQDRWSILPNLTANIGFRYENQQIVSKFDTTAFRVDRLSPRLGLSWDFTNDGRSKIYASYGQFVEAIPMDMNIRSFSAERNPTIYNFDPVSIIPDPAAESDTTHSSILGGYIEPVDPDLKAQYLDEIALGIEREVLPGLSVGLKGIYRRYGRVIEDGYVPDSGDYFIMNPGEGTLGGAFPRAQRQYHALELTAQKRSGDWQFFFSYLLSRMTGNYDGAFHGSGSVTEGGQKDPNINADFDYPEFLINNTGPLTNDRTHQVKFQAGYTFPFKLTASISGFYRSGVPRTRLGWFDLYGRPELFLTERGAEGRGPSSADADIHLGYPLALGPVTVNILVDVFNILNRQNAITIDNRYSFQEADNASPTPTNARYGQGLSFVDPRTLRLGMRISF